MHDKSGGVAGLVFTDFSSGDSCLHLIDCRDIAPFLALISGA